MATRAQKAASRRNIKKAQAARRKKAGKHRRRRAASANANPRRKRRKARRAAANANPHRRRRRRAAAAANANPHRRRRRRAAAAANANPTRRRRRRAAANANPRRRRSSHRANPAGGTTVNVNSNPWFGQPRRHAKAAKKGWAKRKRSHGKARRHTGKKRCKPCRPRRDSRGHFTGGFSRHEMAMLANPGNASLLANPVPMYENQGIMSMATWAHFGTAAVATALGLVVADFVDRIVATRQPADAGAVKATMPWYGRNAVAAQRMRPDAWRLGAQAAGAVIALGLAFWTRNMKFVPWALGGVALGFGSNLLMKITTWWLMPALLKVKDPGEATIANRAYVLEQDDTQTKVQGMFEKYDGVPSLADQQTTPVGSDGTSSKILSPLASASTTPGGVYALGKPQPNGSAPATVGASPHVVNTGRLGLCPHCKQMNGCLSNCPTLCPKCPEYRPFVKAKYGVKAGDNLTQLAALGGVSIDAVNALNGGTPDTYWQPGKTAMVPYGLAMAIELRDSKSPSSVGAPPAAAAETPAPAPAQAAPAPAPTPAPTPAPVAVPASTVAAAPQEVVAQAPVAPTPKPFSIQNLGLAAESENAVAE